MTPPESTTFASPGSTPKGNVAGTAALAVRDVRRAFGGVIALDGCDLDVSPGSIAGLIGPNGSGKTTLFNVITGYVTPDSGTVHLGDTEITGGRPDRIFALGVGRTFQLTRIFPRMTVLENMLVATQRKGRWLTEILRSGSSDSERRRAMELLDFVGLTPKAALLSGQLSYGQRKLLELAYVLVAEPRFLLLDEPAGGVNLSLLNEIAGLIRELNRTGTTFLIVEHNMEFVMSLCDQVTVMHQGRAIATGVPSAVRNDPAVLDAYLGGSEDEFDEVETGETGDGVQTGEAGDVAIRS